MKTASTSTPCMFCNASRESSIWDTGFNTEVFFLALGVLAVAGVWALRRVYNHQIALQRGVKR